MNEIIKIDKITKKYGDRTILDDVSISILRGESVRIYGESGAGKTTFLNILGLLDRNFGGKLYIDGQCVNKMSDTIISKLRNEKIGFVFQSYNLIYNMTAYENILLPATYSNIQDNWAALSQRCDSLMEQLKISHLKDDKIQNLSGGEKQRTAIARALIMNPDIIMADEPTGNLDSANEKIIFDELNDLHNSGKTIILVTHNPQPKVNFDRMLIVEEGKLHEQTPF